MSYQIESIEGIGPSYGKLLAAAKVRTTGALLRRCATPGGRQEVSDETGISKAQLLKWVNLADLMRVPGVGPEFSELLEAAGVDTVKELRNRSADRLAQALVTTNAKRHLTRATPGVRSVRGWIARAARMDPAVTY